MPSLFGLSLPASADWQRSIPARLQNFWHWWLGELRQLLPSQLRRLSPLQQRVILLDVEEERIEIAVRRGDNLHRVGIIGSSPADDTSTRQPPAAALRALLQDERQEHTRVIARLAQQHVLTCIIELPAAARENLSQVLSYEMDRYTPFSNDAACFDYRILATTPDKLTLRLYVTSRSLIERILTQARQLGLTVYAVSIIDTDATERLTDPIDVSINLLPETLREQPDSRGRLIKRALVTFTIVLLTVNLALPFWLQHQRLLQLEQNLSSVRSSAASAIALRDEHRNFLATLERIGQSRKAQPSALSVLNELSTVLPDSTWLSRFELKGGTLQLQGESSASAALIGLVEASALFDGAEFRSPITQDPRTGKENFQIHAQLVRGTAP